MDISTIKEKIIKTLLESPKTTGEIAKSLGYIDANGNGKYNIIKADLNTLQSYNMIRSNKIKKQGVAGPTPTTYRLVYKIENLKEILNKYPNLNSDMRKDEKIITLLSNVYWNSFSFDPSKTILNEFVGIFKGNFKIMIQNSNIFFRTILTNPPEEVLNRFVQIHENSMINIGTQRIKTKLEKCEKTEIDKAFNKTILTENMFRTAFEACVNSDILNNQAEPTAIEMIKNWNVISFDHLVSWEKHA